MRIDVKSVETIPVNKELLQKLLELTNAMQRGDYSGRIITDFSDDIITHIADNLNKLSDKVELNVSGNEYDQSETVNTFIEVISSFTNLDFSKKLPITENGTILDAIATGINILGEELEQSVASKHELELEKQRLKEAKEYAEDANKAKGRFLANMSHEIRTPLNGILGLTEIMLNENIDKTHYQYLEIIRDSGKNLLRIINDLLDFSKIESGKFQLENIEFNFNEVIVASITPHNFVASKKGLTLSYTIDESIPKNVLGDPTRLTQIMTNLLGNAIKFTEKGEITVNFSLLKKNSEEVTIQGVVRDTGIGIPREKMELIFQTFTQADSAVARNYGGTGLGLSIVKSLCQQMQGDIHVQSPPDSISKQGSAFIFTLKLKIPVATNGITTSPSTDIAKLVFSKTVHVLVVDDNKVNLLVAKQMIIKFGAKVTTAESGLEAINLIKAGHDYDIILMDIQMPGLDGFETTRQLRKLNYKKAIVALSANAYENDIKNSYDSGMNDHLQKPFTAKDIFETINKFVS